MSSEGSAEDEAASAATELAAGGDGAVSGTDAAENSALGAGIAGVALSGEGSAVVAVPANGAVAAALMGSALGAVASS